MQTLRQQSAALPAGAAHAGLPDRRRAGRHGQRRRDRADRRFLQPAGLAGVPELDRQQVSVREHGRGRGAVGLRRRLRLRRPVRQVLHRPPGQAGRHLGRDLGVAPGIDQSRRATCWNNSRRRSACATCFSRRAARRRRSSSSSASAIWTAVPRGSCCEIDGAESRRQASPAAGDMARTAARRRRQLVRKPLLRPDPHLWRTMGVVPDDR